MREDIVVLKFGSSVLSSPGEVATAAHEIYRWYREGNRVIAVVSALCQTTDRLAQQAQGIAAEPEPYALAELLSTGERASAALLGMTLDSIGIPSRVVDPREIGMLAVGPVLDSQPVGLDRERLANLLNETWVLVIPGFFAYTERRRLHLLGRGGSDLTAVFLAGSLKAKRCRLLKNVDGVYERDPAVPADAAPARRFVSLGYAHALDVAGRVIQPKAVHFLERHQATAEVAAVGRAYETVVGAGTRALVKAQVAPPKRVLLLGLGTVGGGVYQRLSSMRDRFSIVSVLVRDPERHEAAGVPPHLLQTTPSALNISEADIVVDALPGLEPSRLLVHSFVKRGIDVITANKALIASAGAELSALAARRGGFLLYSAVVGGSAPMLETLRRLNQTEKITEIAGIFNDTCNFVIERCAQGSTLHDAVREAQRRGFADTPADEDLSGRDAARKLQILARHAFGRELHALDVRGIDATELAQMHDACREGQVVRLVGTARREDVRLIGKVGLARLPADHPFASARQGWNALSISGERGTQTLVTGRGAGRWPTAEAVVADLLELSRLRTA